MVIQFGGQWPGEACLLQPIEVLGASYVVGDFFATEKNGWGRTIAQLV